MKHHARPEDGQGITGRLGGWSQSAVINPVNTSNPVDQGQSSVELQCQLSPPGVYTVEFEVGPYILPTATDDAINTPVATIEWSVGGNTVRRKISVLNGASISGPAEYVKVKAFDESINVKARPYLVSIGVTPGTRAGETQPTLQNHLSFAVATGTSATIPIPQDVGVTMLRLLAWNTTAKVDEDSVVVQFLDGAGAVLSAFQNPTLSWFVHIPPGAVSVKITNLSMSVAIVAFPIWAIDG